MQLNTPFDPTQVAPNTGGVGQLPISSETGHVMIITSADQKPTNDNTGSYLQLNVQITEGPSSGATGVIRLNIGNSNTDAVRIAYSDLSAICYVVGWVQPLQDLSVLYNKPFRAVVGFQKGKESEGYTEVKKYFDLQGNKPGEQGKSNAAPTAAPAPAMPAPAQPAPPQATGGFPTPPQPQQQVAAPAQPQQQYAVQDVPMQPAPQQYAPQPPQMPQQPQMPQPPAPGAAPPWAQQG